MSLVTLAGVAKSHGAQHLFDDVNLQVAAGRRIAVVGPNGAGKTTLLEIITGDQQPDDGTVTRARDVVIGYLPQEIAESRGRPALAEVLAGAGAVTGIERRMRHIETEMADATEEDELAELMDEYGRLQHRFEAMGGYGLEAEARRILAGLGFARGGHGAQHGRVLRRLDDAHRAGPPAAAEPGPAAARRADQPPRPGVGRMAAGLPGRLRRRGAAGQPRSRLHQRGGQPGGRAARRQPDRVRRRLRRLRRAARRAHRPARAPGGRAGTQDRAGRALHRALPLQGHQGAPGPEPDQGAGPNGARGRAVAPQQVGQVPLPRAAAQRPDGDHAA